MDEQHVISNLLRSARLLGLAPHAPVVDEAIAQGVEALGAGFDVDTAIDFGRAVLIRATQPASVLATSAA